MDDVTFSKMGGCRTGTQMTLGAHFTAPFFFGLVLKILVIVSANFMILRRSFDKIGLFFNWAKKRRNVTSLGAVFMLAPAGLSLILFHWPTCPKCNNIQPPVQLMPRPCLLCKGVYIYILQYCNPVAAISLDTNIWYLLSHGALCCYKTTKW